LLESGEPIDQGGPVWRRPSFGSSLVGRAELIDDVAAHVLRSRLVTLAGVGGVGKTRIAAAVADRVAARNGGLVAWIDLSTLSVQSAIVYEIATLFGVRAMRGEDLLDKVASAIGDRDFVLIFDNCEHVREAMQLLVRLLLERSSRLRVLCTSREQLGLVDEHVVAVGPLATAGVDSTAVELLVDRLTVTRDELDDAERAMLAEIADRLDGIPLALELVAARCRRLGIIEVGNRLPGRLDQLSDPGRVGRHQTLDATIEWSYSMLRPSEQALLRSLSPFRGSFDLNAVDAVVGHGQVDVETSIASLLDKSLLEREGRRFRLLEMTRDFAARRLSQADEREAAEAAHSSYVRARVVEIHEGLHGRDERTWVAELDTLWSDVRAVVYRLFDRDDAEAAIELVTHLAFESFWRRPEGFAWIDAAAGRWGDRPGPHRRELLGAAAIAAWTQADIETGLGLSSKAVAAEDRPGTALDCLPEGGAIGALVFSGQFEEAMSVARRALVNLDLGNDRWNRVIMHANLANALAISGARTGELDEEVDASIHLAHGIGNPSAIAYAYLVHALATSTTDPLTCRTALEHARAYGSEVDNHWVVTSAATTIAMTPLETAADEVALRMALDAADDLQRTGWTTHAWCAMWGVIAGLFTSGRPAEAALVLGSCEASGVAQLAYQHVPDALIADMPELARYRRLGRQLHFDDVLAIATGQRQPPLLP
jgi:predicted ATPase